MDGPLDLSPRRAGATRRAALGLILAAPAVGCAAVQSTISNFSSYLPGQGPGPAPAPAGPPQEPTAVGTGSIRVGLLLPLSGAGNAGVAAQSMRNAAELALAEFQQSEHPAAGQGRRRHAAGRATGRPAGDRRGRRDHPRSVVRAIAVPGAAQVARARNIPVIAFSTDSSVAGARRLSVELPAGVRCRAHRRLRGERRQAIVRGAAAGQCLRHRGRRRRSSRRRRGAAAASSRSSAIGADRALMQNSARRIAQARRQADALFLADDGEALAGV